MILEKLKIKEILIYPIVFYALFFLLLKFCMFGNVSVTEGWPVLLALCVIPFGYFIYTRTDLLNSAIATVILWLVFFLGENFQRWIVYYGGLKPYGFIGFIILFSLVGVIIGKIKEYTVSKSTETGSIYAKQHLIRVLIFILVVSVLLFLLSMLLDLLSLSLIYLMFNPLVVWVDFILSKIITGLHLSTFWMIMTFVISLLFTFAYYFLLYTISRILIGNIKSNEGWHKLAFILVLVLVILIFLAFALFSVVSLYAGVLGV